MKRAEVAGLVAGLLSAGADARAQNRQPIDLGHGIYAAIGVAVGTGGASGATTVAVPQSNTFMVLTADSNVSIDTSGPAGAAIHHQMFDGNPSTMFGSPAGAYGEILRLAGGAAAVAARAKTRVATDPVQALYLTDIALAAEPDHVATLEVRLAALRALEQRSGNSNERGWLQAGIRDAEAKLKR
jgi:hypothetical protein